MTTFVTELDAELPGLTLPWTEELTANTWTNLDLSSGHTFSLLLVDSTGTALLTKTTGITGADGSVVVAWAAGELGTPVVRGTYTIRLTATETATSKQRPYKPGSPDLLVIV